MCFSVSSTHFSYKDPGNLVKRSPFQGTEFLLWSLRIPEPNFLCKADDLRMGVIWCPSTNFSDMIFLKVIPLVWRRTWPYASCGDGNIISKKLTSMKNRCPHWSTDLAVTFSDLPILGSRHPRSRHSGQHHAEETAGFSPGWRVRWHVHLERERPPTRRPSPRDPCRSSPRSRPRGRGHCGHCGHGMSSETYRPGFNARNLTQDLHLTWKELENSGSVPRSCWTFEPASCGSAMVKDSPSET